MKTTKKILIMGKDGKEFYVFDQYYKDRKQYHVVGFTSVLASKKFSYPPELAGSLYPQGIPILPESELFDLLDYYRIDEVVFAYRSVSYEHISRLERKIRSLQTDFKLAEVQRHMTPCSKPVFALTSLLPGNLFAQKVLDEVVALVPHKKVAICHYPDWHKQIEDGDLASWEEFQGVRLESHHYQGFAITKVLSLAEQEADVIVWNGKDDTPLVKPGCHIMVFPVTSANWKQCYPGRVNLELAEVVLFEQSLTASERKQFQLRNPKAHLLEEINDLKEYLTHRFEEIPTT